MIVIDRSFHDTYDRGSLGNVKKNNNLIIFGIASSSSRVLSRLLINFCFFCGSLKSDPLSEVIYLFLCELVLHICFYNEIYTYSNFSGAKLRWKFI